MDSDYNTALTDKAKQFPRIVSIFGPEFLKPIVNSVSPKKHAVYWWLRTSVDRNNDVWLGYLDHCLDIAIPILEDKWLVDKKSEIVGQLKDTDKFYEAFAEIEWIAKLADKNLDLAITPFYPKEGPDLGVKVGGSEIYIEITSLNLSQLEQKNENMWLELQTRINKIVSHRHVSITTKGDFSPRDVSPLVAAIKNKISELEGKDDRNPTSIFYFSKDDIREWYGFDGLNYPADVQINWKKYPLYLEEVRAKASVSIRFLSEKKLNTFVGTGGVLSSGMHDRIKKAVLKKIRQLKVGPADAPKIVVLDLSRTYADEILVGWGIQGQDAYEWLVDKRTGKTVSGRDIRLNNGAFSMTKSISAVIIPRKIEDATGIHLIGDAILNPEATTPISAELLTQIID
jgi:hypothetical protein